MEPLEQQALFEIAMSVGDGMDMRAMLQTALSVTMRQLGCAMGAVVQTPPGEAAKVVQGIPRHIANNPDLANLCQCLRDGTLTVTDGQPVCIQGAGPQLLVFSLPGFGVLVLGVYGRTYSKAMLGTLALIAKKISAACIACQQIEIIRDTKEKLRAGLEEAREGRRMAEEANRLKSEFVANMSHELLTPLTSIIGYSRIAAERMNEVTGSLNNHLPQQVAAGGANGSGGGAPPAPEFEERARLAGLKSADAALFNRIVVKQGERLLELINDLMDLSMLDAGQMKVQEGVASARILLYTVVNRQSTFAGEKKIRLTSNINELIAKDILFMTDNTRLEKVLDHLGQNAIKYSDGGTVGFSAALNGDRVEFKVTDQGIGIPENKRSAIFDAFRQLDGGSTRSQGGVGLGLALAKKLVAAMGGVIEVASEVGKGSEFTVSLPYRPAKD
ncbi:MAG: HAMP domain-containing histidine kinase [Nitrospinae bacterium]|nr:HAMP domain-containing histidine kinase [Nitrospinota bacterium]